jgi:hypothetical protein
MLERCARLASFALLVLVAHQLRDPCMRDVWGAPRPEALRACEASDPAGHYTSGQLKSSTTFSFFGIDPKGTDISCGPLEPRRVIDWQAHGNSLGEHIAGPHCVDT